MDNVIINGDIKTMSPNKKLSGEIKVLLKSRFIENFDLAFMYLNSDPEGYYAQIEEDGMLSDFEAMDCKYSSETKTRYSEIHGKKKKKEEKEREKAEKKAQKEAEKNAKKEEKQKEKEEKKKNK